MLWAIVKGGPVMIPILAGSVLGLAIIIVKLRMLFKIRLDAEAFTDTIIAKVQAKRFDEALSLCVALPGYPIANTLRAGLEAFDPQRLEAHEIEKALERSGNREVNGLEKYIGGLISIIGIEPLLGFLGTITGLIRAFMAWETAGTDITVSQLAGGIYEAMITTAAGLIIAVPFYLVCNYIISRIKYISFELGDCSMRLAEAIAKVRRKV